VRTAKNVVRNDTQSGENRVGFDHLRPHSRAAL
jgi:hypothetical protein